MGSSFSLVIVGHAGRAMSEELYVFVGCWMFSPSLSKRKMKIPMGALKRQCIPNGPDSCKCWAVPFPEVLQDGEDHMYLAFN